MDDVTLLCTEEITEVFRNYRSALKHTSFKTPLQRALAFSNQVRSVKLEQLRQFQQDQVTALLPPGPRTRNNVDVVYLLATSPKTWKLRVPCTLLSKANSLALVRTDKQGKVVVKRLTEGKAVRLFVQKLSVTQPGMPKFVHKSASTQLRLLFDLSDIDEIWRNHTFEIQRLQEFVVPMKHSASLTRAHWKQSTHKGTYYVIHNDQEIAARGGLHSRVRSLMGSESQNAHLIVNATASNVVSVKRTKPDPHIDSFCEEIVSLLESSVCRDHEHVEEVVCDFLHDIHGRPVLLSCEGYTFTTLKRALTRKMLPSLNQDVMLMTEATQETVERIPTPTVRSRTLSPKRKVMARVTASQTNLLLKRPSLKPDFSRTQFRLDSVASSYDAMVSKVKAYKEELKIAINFVDKYGGIQFWNPILHKISEVFRADQTLKQYYEHLNFEEGAMLQRGYQRILEGNYNLYYKKSMTNVHTGKGIDVAAFQAFVANVGEALDGYPILQSDIQTIIERFRSFESCICPK